jgi:hypothetical protein
MRRVAAALVLLALGAPANAYAPTLERTVLVLLRTLAYDRALPARVAGELRIGVVHAGDAASRQEAADVAQILAGLEGTTVAGRALGEPVAIEGAAVDPAAPIGAIVLCRGLSADELRAVAAVTRERDLSTLALDPGYVGQGATLGVEQRGARLEVVVDVGSAREEGADFDSELLDLARIAGAP